MLNSQSNSIGFYSHNIRISSINLDKRTLMKDVVEVEDVEGEEDIPKVDTPVTTDMKVMTTIKKMVDKAVEVM